MYTSNPFPQPSLQTDTKRGHYVKRWAGLKNERDQWMPTYEQCADYVLPYIGLRYENETSTNAARRPKRSRRMPVIINNKHVIAARTLINGLAGGLTSPSRPWIKLGVPKGSGNVDDEGKRWLWGASQSVMWLAQVTNYYGATKLQYRDLVVYGPSLKIIDRHPEKLANCVHAPMGSYCLMLGEDDKVNGFMREKMWRVGQMVERFGLERVSKQVKRDYDSGDYEKEHQVMHVCEPNRLYRKGKLGAAGFKIASVFYETRCGEEEQQLLSVKGYDTQPFSAPRWDYLSGDTYGPGATMDTLGDIKALQTLEFRKAQAIDKQVTPPTQSPATLQGKRVSHMPGGNTIVAEVQGKITSLYDVRPDMQALHLEIREHEMRIEQGYYSDVLRTATDLTRQNVKAAEIDQRTVEQMMLFAPVLENLFTDMLDVDVKRLMYIGMEIGLIPPMPKSLRERQFTVEYTSILAQAQKAAAVGSIERTFSFAGSLLAAYPEAKDKLDVDAAIEEYADALGAPSTILVPERGVAELRQMRQQQAQQQAAMQQTAVGVDAAKQLSETQLTEPSALQYLIGGAGV